MRSAAPALTEGSVAVPGERGVAGRSGGVGPGPGGWRRWRQGRAAQHCAPGRPRPGSGPDGPSRLGSGVGRAPWACGGAPALCGPRAAGTRPAVPIGSAWLGAVGSRKVPPTHTARCPGRAWSPRGLAESWAGHRGFLSQGLYLSS